MQPWLEPAIIVSQRRSTSRTAPMQTPGNKRTRAMGPQPQEEMVVIRRWRRIMLRILLMIQQALVHTLTFRMNMPGFQGQRARQMSQDLDLLANEELDYLQDQILDQTQRRMSDTDSWSMASLSQKAPMTPPRARGQRSSHHNDEEEIPQCHCRRRQSSSSRTKRAQTMAGHSGGAAGGTNHTGHASSSS